MLAESTDGILWSRPYWATDLGAWSYADPFEYEGDLCIVTYRKEGITLFRTRKDGLASCGTDGEGSFWTQPFTMPEGELSLNADCSAGSMEVEVLDQDGLVVEGFESAGCRFASADSTELPLRWEKGDLASIVGRTVHLRFLLNNARVYSLRQGRAHPQEEILP